MRLKADGVPARRYGRYFVYFPELEQPFILGSTGRMIRGQLAHCSECDREFFRRLKRESEWRTCSKPCSRKRMGRDRRAKIVARSRGPKKTTLDRWFSLLVRHIGRCRRCGTTTSLQCAHIISRRYLGVRYDSSNAICLCAKDHMYFTHRPLEFEEYIVGEFGEAALSELKRKARAFVSPLDREAVAAALYAQADALGLTHRLGKRGHSGWTGLYDEDAEPRALALRTTQPDMEASRG